MLSSIAGNVVKFGEASDASPLYQVGVSFLGGASAATMPGISPTRLVYLKFGEAISAGQPCFYGAVPGEVMRDALPGATGPAVLIAFQTGAAGTFGLFVLEGKVPILGSAALTANPVYLTALSDALFTSTAAAGRQVVGCGVNIASAATITPVSAVRQVGSKMVTLRIGTVTPFIGMTVTGTGIAASTVITGYGPKARQYMLNNAATSSGTGDLTLGYGFFAIAAISAPCITPNA